MFKKCANHRGNSTCRLQETVIHFNVQFFVGLPLIGSDDPYPDFMVNL
jgi:hypothetical protein